MEAFMITNISNRNLNEDKLNKDIDNFEITHGEKAYLFMNEETIDELMRSSNVNPRERGAVCLYMGRKVFYDSNLKFGEVEIR